MHKQKKKKKAMLIQFFGIQPKTHFVLMDSNHSPLTTNKHHHHQTPSFSIPTPQQNKHDMDESVTLNAQCHRYHRRHHLFHVQRTYRIYVASLTPLPRPMDYKCLSFSFVAPLHVSPLLPGQWFTGEKKKLMLYIRFFLFSIQ